MRFLPVLSLFFVLCLLPISTQAQWSHATCTDDVTINDFKTEHIVGNDTPTGKDQGIDKPIKMAFDNILHPTPEFVD